MGTIKGCQGVGEYVECARETREHKQIERGQKSIRPYQRSRKTFSIESFSRMCVCKFTDL